MKKKYFIALVIAVIALVGYSAQSSNGDEGLSSLTMLNLDALAQGESSGGNCEPSTSRECCVCNGIHYTYQASVNYQCETRSNCYHW